MNVETISSESLCKELAYLFGVYLTDGSISHFSDKWGTYNNFSLKAIDKEFVERTLNCIKKIKPSCKANVYEQRAMIRYWPDGRISKCQKQYCINVGFTDWKEFFEGQTGKKHHIPALIWDAPLQIKKWFIAGIMDGDGYITFHTRPDKTTQWTIGVGKTEGGWIMEFNEFLHKIGIKTQKMQRITKVGVNERNSPLITFNINIKSFVSNGLFFTISRKQNRLENYIETFRDLTLHILRDEDKVQTIL